MDNSIADNFGKQAQGFADGAADKIQSGVNGTKRIVDEAGNAIADNVETIRSKTGPTIRQVAGQARSMAKQGMDSVSSAARQLSDSVSDASDNVISYTKAKPVNALLIAAGAGALLVTLISALSRSRD